MKKEDPRIDEYISQSADFARPILTKLRQLVHRACPDAEETMKWSFPHFTCAGEILCSMASFKKHCSLGFWKAALLEESGRFPDSVRRDAMGQFGRISSLDDLPPDEVLISLIGEAARLNREKIKLPAKRPAERKELVIPDDLTAALAEKPAAHAVFEKFSYSSRKDYVEWITEAKTVATRQRRLATAVEWIAEGKTRHWKYSRN